MSQERELLLCKSQGKKMISFSGIDCAGKSTQIEKVIELLKKGGRRYKIIHSRGGYTPVLEFIKWLIRRDKGQEKNHDNSYRATIHGNPRKRKMLLWISILDLSLYYGIYFRFIEFFGRTIIADRYFWDSYIDFTMKYPELEFVKWKIWKFAKWIYLKPKCTIVYTIPAELSMYRSTLKEEPWPEAKEVREDRINRYFTEIRNNRWQYVIDASGSIDSVFDDTMKVINTSINIKRKQ